MQKSALSVDPDKSPEADCRGASPRRRLEIANLSSMLVG